MVLDIKDDLFSLCREHGRPNHGIISFRMFFATSVDLSILVRKASVHLVKVSVRTTFLYPLQGSILAKSICQASPG